MVDGAAVIVPGSNLGSATTAQGSGSVNRSSKDPFGHDALVRLSQVVAGSLLTYAHATLNIALTKLSVGQKKAKSRHWLPGAQLVFVEVKLPPQGYSNDLAS